MSKNLSRTPSVSERRRQEELRQKKTRQRNLIIGGALLALVAIATIALFLTRDEGSDNATGTELTGDRPLATIEPALRDGYYDEPPAMTIDTTQAYQAVIVMEDGGEMRFNLFDDEAPLTVNNFVFLATQGFYDGTTFHRVLQDFMAQGGDPLGAGTGGPGYAFADETDNNLTFDRRGLLAMANSGPDTNGSQFFITFAPATHLNGDHTIFGELVEGDDVLSSISLRAPETATEPGDRISTITIIEQ